ncbi:MAG: prepilin-type N-terminal cleavage/methylation domain-containing protein [Candidatus Riflebacteria bacterium]|nr:prepilin-type N-terminal cleavage/methylation domain-containing protein [Candidatus Riflebacteria bacterium]
MTRTRSGFTLMEIMVVIIVIAVLASVAGPMIGSITDQGRASATKSKLSSLKSAMLAFQSDVGRMPFNGAPGGSKTAANYIQSVVLGDTIDTNVLVCEEDIASTSVSFYKTRRWKGPYMDADPSDFMYDSWGEQIKYHAQAGISNLYLWSKGADMGWSDATANDGSNVEEVTCQTSIDNGDVDDITLSVAKIRGVFL